MKSRGRSIAWTVLYAAREIRQIRQTVRDKQKINHKTGGKRNDYRRRLYADVVFSGGSTSFRYLDKRLELSLQHRVDERLKKYSKDGKQSTIVVKVTNSMAQKHVVWLGGSSFSSNNGFKNMVHTREEYMEKGPACCRFNPVFSF